MALKAIESKKIWIEKKQNCRGQAITEYILLLSVIVMTFAMVGRMMLRSGIATSLMNNVLKGPFASAYQYGHTQAKGYNDGGPHLHPRAEDDSSSFRIFLNESGNK